MTKAAIVSISTRILLKLLHLEGGSIHQVNLNWARASIDVIISHPDFPETDELSELPVQMITLQNTYAPCGHVVSPVWLEPPAARA